MLLQRIARAVALLWAGLRSVGTNFGGTSLFFKGLLMIRHTKDYAVATINGTPAPRGDTPFARTVGIDHKQAIAGEGFRLFRWSGRIRFWGAAVIWRAP